MAPFNTQYTLSVELTRLQPIRLLSDKIGTAALSLLRLFQDSGSDVMAENDLARIFECHRIDGNMANIFRSAIVCPQNPLWASLHHLYEKVWLDNKPGPTVMRALKQQEYFPMVIECSFLAWVHERRSLAVAFKRFFEKDAEEAPPGITVANPREEYILAILRACEDQTAAFSWDACLQAVSARLHLSQEHTASALPPVILRSALRMLPIVQSLPEQRTMVINCSAANGVCAMIVWAHYILSLNVLIYTYIEDSDDSESAEPYQSELFGKSSKAAQVIVNLKTGSMDPSVILMAESEELFRFTPDVDEPVIDATYKIRARGFGQHVLNSQNLKMGKESAIREMVNITCAFATILSAHLCENNYPGGIVSTKSDIRVRSDQWRSLSEQQLIQTMRLIFDDESIDSTTFEDTKSTCSGKSLDEHLEIPKQILLAYQKSHENGLDADLKKLLWRTAVDRMRKLSVLILALSFVRNCGKLDDVLLCNAQNFANMMETHALASFIKTWDGKSGIAIPANVWFHAVVLLIGGYKANPVYDSMSLFSSHGWSVFVSTWGSTDPSFTDAGYITVYPGVPRRDEIRKRAIMDGPLQGIASGDWGIIERSGTVTTVRCHKELGYHNPLIGESFDAFLINLRIVSGEGGNDLPRRTGHLELFHANWGLQKTQPCEHKQNKADKVTLPAGCATSSLFTDKPYSQHGLTEQLLIYLTAGNQASRWRALLAIAHYHKHVATTVGQHRQVLLREEGCCFQCTIDQAFLQGGLWFIVL
jgi:hypothetical protein